MYARELRDARMKPRQTEAQGYAAEREREKETERAVERQFRTRIHADRLQVRTGGGSILKRERSGFERLEKYRYSSHGLRPLNKPAK